MSEMFEIEARLEKKGITLDAMVEAAMGLYISHGMPDDQAAENIRGKMQKYLADPNVASLLLGAVLLEEELYENRKDSEIAEDPVFSSAMRSSAWLSPNVSEEPTHGSSLPGTTRKSPASLLRSDPFSTMPWQA